VIHDAVRPFVTQREIRETIEAARDAGAAIVATSPVETVKEVDGIHISGTLDRNRIRLAQTPQAFRADLLRRAYAAAAEEGFVGTDEASLVERIGVKVVVVEADRRNRKITTPDDLKLAEFLASEGGDR
jgi:2-C-methyl-D-erythritol 4-phosphate cytidylyltransferase